MVLVDAPLETVPMFVRAGAILPNGPVLNYVGEKAFDPVTFNIYPDDKGEATGSLYEDDGVSPAYKQDGFRRTLVNAKRSVAGYVVTVSPPQGSYNPGSRKLSFVVKATGRVHNVVTVTDNSSAQTIKVN